MKDLRYVGMKEYMYNIRELLIVVDMVNGFTKDGSLHDPSIMKIVPEIKSLIDDYFKENVFFFRDCHTTHSIEFNDFPPHCLFGDRESEIIDELNGYSINGNTFYKNSTSGLFAPYFLDYIESMEKLDSVVITGCCTDLCVMNLAIPLKCYFNENNRRVNVIVPEDAVETYDIPESHNAEEYNEMALKLMKLNGVKVIKHFGGNK